MYTKNWQVIKDDTKHTFEVCGLEGNTNPFTNQVYAMQRDGMNVSCVLLPVTNKNASKSTIKIINYITENGLYERLQNQHRKIVQTQSNQYEDLDF
ncbi:MAG: hypothetical protein JST43_11120 [Bacteroidetes bacterium]|nr:hypothetical protein [Bacteroidota bacterium]MBS1540066.1 hypothetical protein [Bacteroidota bacterium]